MKDKVVFEKHSGSVVIKVPKYFPYLVAGCLLLCLCLAIDMAFSLQNTDIITKFTLQLEIVTHFFILIATFKVYKNATRDGKNILLWFFITNISTSLMDLYGYFIKYFSEYNLFHLGTGTTLLRFSFFLIWVIAILMFLFRILKSYVLQIESSTRIWLAFVIINFTTILLCLSSIHYSSTIFSLSVILQIISFILQIIVFDFAILCLMHAESKGLILFLLGIIGIVSGYLFVVYAISSQTYMSIYGEFLWFIGLLFNWFGVLLIQYRDDYNIKNWVRKDNSIKSKLVFWCFAMAIVSFLLFFVIAYAFALISKTVLLGLPVFIIIYSAIVIVFSVYIGGYFEEPFKKIASNIQVLMQRDKKISLDSNFSIEEFIFLQKFIVDAFERLEQDQNKKQLGEITAQVAHDIQSPLSSLQTIVQSTTGIPENDRITLRAVAMQIGDITSHMLHKYKSQSEDSEKLRQHVLVSANLLQELSAKRYEYKESGIEFRHQFDPQANFAFIHVEPIEFRRMISNIINNAVDALGDSVEKQRKVEVTLKTNNEWVIISIEDNGHGMPAEILEKIRKSTPVTFGKKDGSGLGLTQVRETLKRNLGEFEMYSGRHGTKVILFFPKITAPNWIADEIKIISGDTVVILDDDSSIHGAWDARLAPVLAKNPDLRVKHFSDGVEFLNFINELAPKFRESICFLSDYELLGQKLNGIDILQQVAIKRSVLVTSHYAEINVRRAASEIHVKILPKDLVFAVNIKVDKQIIPGSKIVGMVWVDDEKGWMDYLIDKYYKDVKIDAYYDPISFLDDVAQYPLDTKIFLDNYYYTETGSYDLEGTMLAQKLHEMGFTKLFLLSGEVFQVPDYLTLILKTDQENLSRLDKL